MGLFGFLGNIAKGVAKLGVGAVKAAVGKATFGASDAVLAALKKRGELKQAEATEQYNLQQLALAEKMRPLSPRAVRTSTILDEATEPPRQLTKAQIYGREGYSYAAAKMALSGKDPTVPRRSAVAAPPRPRAAAPKPAPKRATKPAAARSGRKPPTGGLDLKALSASWRAAGKPGTWQGWIAQNK